MTSRTVLLVALPMLLASCSSGESHDDTIAVIAADDARGLVIRYHDSSLDFTFEGTTDAEWNRARLVRSDGMVITDLAMPTELDASGNAVLPVVNTAPIVLSATEARAYGAALESTLVFLSMEQDQDSVFLDLHRPTLGMQIAFLDQDQNASTLGADRTLCNEWLRDPTGGPKHFHADHGTVDLQSVPYFWHWVCLIHDVACINCGSILCGPDCQPGTDCLGRCGGGC